MSVKKTIEQSLSETNMTMISNDSFYELTKDNKVLRISKKQEIYLRTAIYGFDFYFNSVVPIQINDKLLVDYSTPKYHHVSGFDEFDLLCPSMAEPYDSVNQYLDFANLQKGNVVLDIGAYSGLSSIAFSKCVGENGIVYSLEPDENNYYCLEKNIEAYYNHGYPQNIKLFKKAIWTHTGSLEFSSECNMGSSAVDIVGSRGFTVSVECTTLSDFASDQNIQSIDFIKCDIEGSEAYIFNDEKFFQKYKPKIILETHKINGVYCNQTCIDTLSKYGYSHKIVEQNGLELPLIEFEI